MCFNVKVECSTVNLDHVKYDRFIEWWIYSKLREFMAWEGRAWSSTQLSAVLEEMLTKIEPENIQIYRFESDRIKTMEPSKYQG